MCHLGHGRRFRRSRENDLVNLFALSFPHKYENPLTHCRRSKCNSGQEIRTGTPEFGDVSTGEIINLPAGLARNWFGL